MFNIKIIDRLLNSLFYRTEHVELAKMSVAFGVAVSLFLLIIKAIAWLVTDSVSMQASMADSLLDVLASFVVYHALKYSYVKFDKEHNFGHEKVEGIVAIFQCLVVFYSGIMILGEAYEAWFNPEHIKNTSIGVAVMLVSTIAVYVLVYFQKYVTTKTGSILVRGDSLHYLSDFCMNLGVITSLLISKFIPQIDAVFGGAVGVYVLYSAFLIMRNALIDLMDESLPENAQTQIKETVTATSGVLSLKRLRTRNAGMKKHIEVTIGVDKKLNLTDACLIAKNVEENLLRLYEKMDVVVITEAC